MLDAWALLALVFGEEPAASTVKEIFEKEDASRSHVHMSWVNLGEVYYMLGRKKGTNTADEVLKDIQMLPLTLHVPSKADILAAARIKANHRLSYADAFAVSLAEKTGGVLFTGDPEILALSGIFRVRRLSRGV
ncbi:type II toxin-antitoxin system VapC family toxin [Desulfacinum infernum]|uniref:type II toxin-antitoxin system VapC family toxin n=1 Tax=Desulfacinum infernum TaxID=35837 RepID=UPI0015B42642|nr:type II toxin-antitoxin system VapC family toxin [Desulfacinum infernum]MBC7359929.1 type II toxin-antitoxin system VapC family toxin [Desulfacinum sp.]